MGSVETSRDLGSILSSTQTAERPKAMVTAALSSSPHGIIGGFIIWRWKSSPSPEQLSHNGWLLPPCSAKISPFEIAADTSSLTAFRDHLFMAANVNNILRANWTCASNTTSSSVACHWIGVTCGARHQRVVSLDLGDIPSAFGNLTVLKGLYLGYNSLEGQVPEPIGRLAKLEIMSLVMNNLGGHVPANLFNITSLILLSFAGNHLMGHLPATIGFGLPNLKELYLGLNQFRGTIPDSFASSSRLTVLDLCHNKFTGSSPSMLGNLGLLEFLRIGENNLIINGAVFIASLNNCRHLSHLNIVSNQVNGPLPSSFGNLTSSLQSLRASNCGIKGKIPDDIRNMSKLEVLDLSTNQLVGSLPQLQALSNIEQLGGSFPDDICHLPRMGLLDFQINKISGPLPDCLGNITSLRYLNLCINEMCGSISVSLWDFKHILQLNLSSDSFTGHLPQDIGTLRAAIYINLSLNQLSGTLPSAIGSLQTLANFSLAHNKFEASVPKSFGKLLSMVELDLSYNNLSGEIPNSLQELSHMKILNVSVNLFSGEIPSDSQIRFVGPVNKTVLSF